MSLACKTDEKAGLCLERTLGVGEVLCVISPSLSSLVEWRVLAVPWLAAVPTVRRDVGRGAK